MFPYLRKHYRRFNRTILECKYKLNDHFYDEKNSFNRTILECKFYKDVVVLKNRVSFNRTILECKLIYTQYLSIVRTVLIEPYWNVNIA